jgi:hypothetical protein
VPETSIAPPLTLDQILRWADAHFRRHCTWPDFGSGHIPGTGGESWWAVDAALRHGFRGLPGGTSLGRLLTTKRGVQDKAAEPRLTVAQIRAWAEDHLTRTGLWPDQGSGEIPGTEENWKAVEAALRLGRRGLRGGSSLAQLLFTRHRLRKKSAG